jgi:hypothetical protein
LVEGFAGAAVTLQHLNTQLTLGASTMIECHESTFLMTPAQHRKWAANARRRGRPDLAQHHEQLARAIERIAQRQAEHNANRVPPLSRAAQKSPA